MTSDRGPAFPFPSDTNEIIEIDEEGNVSPPMQPDRFDALAAGLRKMRDKASQKRKDAQAQLSWTEDQRERRECLGTRNTCAWIIDMIKILMREHGIEP